MALSPTSSSSWVCNLPMFSIRVVIKECLLVPCVKPDRPRIAASYSSLIWSSRRATSERCVFTFVSDMVILLFRQRATFHNRQIIDLELALSRCLFVVKYTWVNHTQVHHIRVLAVVEHSLEYGFLWQDRQVNIYLEVCVS